MSLVTRSADASMDASTGMMAPQITGLIAGSNLDVAAPCYIASTGLVHMCDATAADALAVMAGFTPRAVKAGQPVTLYSAGARFRYGTGLTPGAKLFVGATAGRLDDAPTVGDPVGVAQVITPTDIRVTRLITDTDADTIGGG